MLVENCSQYLSEPIILGALFAYARLANAPGKATPDWEHETTRDKSEKIEKSLSHHNAQLHLRLLTNWLLGNNQKTIGGCVLTIRSASDLRSAGFVHVNLQSEVEELIKLLRRVEQNPILSPDDISRVHTLAMVVWHHFEGLEMASRVLGARGTGPQPLVQEADLQRMRRNMQAIDGFDRLFRQPSSEGIQNKAGEALTAINSLFEYWLLEPKSMISLLLEPFWHNLFAAVNSAIGKADNIYKDKFPGLRIHHSFNGFGDERSKDYMEVLCNGNILMELLLNVTTNVWKHVAKKVYPSTKDISVAWKFEMKGTNGILNVCDNGPRLLEGTNFFPPTGGNARYLPHVKDFGGNIMADKNKDTGSSQIDINLYCRRLA
jgi:hypothetical protein